MGGSGKCSIQIGTRRKKNEKKMDKRKSKKIQIKSKVTNFWENKIK